MVIGQSCRMTGGLPLIPDPRTYLPDDRLWDTGSRPSIPRLRHRLRLERFWVSYPGSYPIAVGTPNYASHVCPGRASQWLCRLP